MLSLPSYHFAWIQHSDLLLFLCVSSRSYFFHHLRLSLLPPYIPSRQRFGRGDRGGGLLQVGEGEGLLGKRVRHNNDDLTMMWLKGRREARLTVEAIRVEGGAIELELHL